MIDKMVARGERRERPNYSKIFGVLEFGNY